MKKFIIGFSLLFSMNSFASGDSCYESLWDVWGDLDSYKKEIKIGTNFSKNVSSNILTRSCYDSLQLCSDSEMKRLTHHYDDDLGDVDYKKIWNQLRDLKFMCDRIVKYRIENN